MIIYKVTNIKTNQSYIGQTMRSLKIRKAEHMRYVSNIKKSKHPTIFHLALKEYGFYNFNWEIIEICNSYDHMNERERFYIHLLNTITPYGYNQTSGGAMDGSMSDEIRAKIANSMVEVHKDPEYRARVYAKLKGLVPPNKGIKMSQVQIAKLSAARKAIHADPDYINPNKGQIRTEDQKKRIREGQKGKMVTGSEWLDAHKDQYTDEVRAKMSAKRLGKKPANTKKVMCIETGAIYAGLTDAGLANGINRQTIFNNIKGISKTAKGLHFRYIDDN